MKKVIVGLIGLFTLLPLIIYNSPFGKIDYTPIPAGKPAPPLNPYLLDVASTFDQNFRSLMAHYHVPGAAVAIVKDDQILWMKGYGKKQAGTDKYVDAYTVFRLGSLSKGFTGVLSSILAKDSLLDLDAPVHQYIPEFNMYYPQYTEQVKVRNVLSHTAGFPYHTYTNMIEQGLTMNQLIPLMKKVRPVAKPGEIYSYQNAAFSLAGEAMQKATGKTFEALLQERIFKPLNMQFASASYFNMTSNPNIAKPHVIGRRGVLERPITKKYYNAAPAGGVNASISDMANWMTCLLGHRPDVADFQTLERTFTPQIHTPLERSIRYEYAGAKSMAYGLGWRVLQTEEDVYVLHGGFVNGFRNEISINRDKGVAICVLTNSASDLSRQAVASFWKLYTSLLPQIMTFDQQQAKS